MLYMINVSNHNTKKISFGIFPLLGVDKCLSSLCTNPFRAPPPPKKPYTQSPNTVNNT